MKLVVLTLTTSSNIGIGTVPNFSLEVHKLGYEILKLGLGLNPLFSFIQNDIQTEYLPGKNIAHKPKTSSTRISSLSQSSAL